MSPSAGGAKARVRLNGRKQRRPGSLQRVLNSEVGDFSSLRSLRFNCSECSWQRVTACTDRRMTVWQVYRKEERMVKQRPGQNIICRDYLTCLWNTSRLWLLNVPITVSYFIRVIVEMAGIATWIFSFKLGFLLKENMADYFKIINLNYLVELMFVNFNK